MLKGSTISVICILLSADIAFGQIRLPPVINNNMVLQQQSKVALWGDATANTQLTVSTTWDNRKYKTKSDQSGKWKVAVSTGKAGGPWEISFQEGSEKQTLSNVMLGEVWLCSGQSNMEMTFKGFGVTTQPILNQPGSEANNPNIRLFTVDRATAAHPKEEVNGNWKECTTESATNFSAVAYQFGKMLWDSLKVPVGLISTSWGGARMEQWMSGDALKAFPEIKISAGIDTMKVLDREPTVLFNAMLTPLSNYGIRGFIWYQGESNRDQPILYARLMPAMVAEWRKEWGNKKLPFYYVQIAPFTYPKDKNSYYNVLIREAQLIALKNIPNSGMAVIVDVGSSLKVHPPDKTTVSKRLAWLALAKTYGRKEIAWEGPSYRSMKIAGDKAILSFDHASGGFRSPGTGLVNFEIAGMDKVFYPAKATILEGGKIEVENSTVPSPVAVRYAFKNWVVGDLYNAEGLPCSSFRTDKWDIPPFKFK
ncbi:MAG TPA: sialate O-acetylesterase [Puia sp.]|nr:sialate O-acetylesterase [Puia sp.]